MISVSQIKYLAFEGGGGKGVAYLGAIEALENKGVLPVKSEKSNVLGISGSSTGAINALMLSMHMSSIEIENELKSKNFEEFYKKDEPNNFIYRAVYTKRGITDNPLNPAPFQDKSKITVGFGVDLIEEIETEEYKKSKKKEDLERQIIPARWLCATKNEAEAYAANNLKSYSYLLNNRLILALGLGYNPNTAISKIYNKLIDSEKVQKSDDGMLKQVLSNASNFPKYVYNLLYDRGAFVGFDPRQYFSSLITRIIYQKFGKEVDGATLNFEEFYNITEIDIRISGANLSNQIPVYFSKNDTPQFPVAEAVGMAMSMPMIFKPVYVDAVVNKNKDDEYQKKYKGFYVDAGTIRNFPIHAFDDEGSNSDVLNENILGFQLTSGAENVEEFSSSRRLIVQDKELAKLYKDFEEEYKVKNSYVIDKVKYPGKLDFEVIYPFRYGTVKKFKVDNIVGTTFFKFAGDLLNSVMYYTEEGQIRSSKEKEQVINLFTYHIFTRDFDPIEPLSNFVRKKAFKKTMDLLK